MGFGCFSGGALSWMVGVLGLLIHQMGLSLLTLKNKKIGKNNKKKKIGFL